MILDTTWLADPLLLLVNLLAAFRLTWLFTRDSLPPLPRVREAVRIYAWVRWRKRHPSHGVDRVRDAYGDDPPLSAFLECAWCVGFWSSVGVTLLATVLPALWWFLAVPLAMSAVIGLATLFVERGE